jgi:hypothetical protein
MTLRTPAELQARYPWLTYHHGHYHVATKMPMSADQRARRERIVRDLNALRDATRRGAAA